ncbi:MAG: DUF4173 domain-containing protein [Pseudomonadota bacterium]
MKQTMMQAVPLAVRQDGWWLGPVERPRRPAGGLTARDVPIWAGPAVLLALIALGDLLVWQVSPGLSLAVFGALVGAAALALAGVRGRRLATGGGGLALSLLPLVELVQPLSVLIFLAGLSAVCALAAGLRAGHIARGALRLWWVGPSASALAAATALLGASLPSIPPAFARTLIAGWAVPVLLGSVFAWLLAGANPVIDGWIDALTTIDPPSPDGWRTAFWIALALLLWPVLHLTRLQERLRPRPRRAGPYRPGLINAASVGRSLLIFNALFAMQTCLDALLLGTGTGLPEGMTYAAYAHRGAYPLLVTALLAGGFAILARPFADRPLVRALLLVWLAQTLALVAASVVRLELYVEVYALTRLRLAAFVWMGLVAAGLCVVFAQVAARQDNAWMLARTGALGAVTLYACCFVSFDGLIARTNLAAPHARGLSYVCTLGEDALPALRAWEARTGRTLCGSYDRPRLSAPGDWREWGFRNARTRHSLAAMERSE